MKEGEKGVLCSEVASVGAGRGRGKRVACAHGELGAQQIVQPAN